MAGRRTRRYAGAVSSRRRGVAALWLTTSLLTLVTACGGTGQPAAHASVRASPSTAPAILSDGKRIKGMNVEPAMRPWRYDGANPDGWWCPPGQCADVANGTRFVDSEMPLIHDLGATMLRLEFPWALIEPERGVYDWSRADYIVNSARANGVELQPVLVHTPAWAAGGATPTASAAPTAADFGAFVTAVAGRYKGQVSYWEMWNEPDDTKYFKATENVYVTRILIPGARAVRAASPDARVIAGGPASPNVNWIRFLYSFGAKGLFDIMAFHDYTGGPQILKDAATVQATLAAEGDSTMPVWLGEYGAQENMIHDLNQRGLMTSVLTGNGPLAAAEWYSLRDDDAMDCCPARPIVVAYWGLVQRHSLTPKLGYETMKAIVPAKPTGA